MAEFIEVMNNYKRLCETCHKSGCYSKCPLYEPSHGGCKTYLKNHPYEAETIIMNWANKNKIK